MSVKKPIMVNIIGRIQDYNRILNDIIITKKVEAVSAFGQIEKNNFLLDVNDKNVDRLVDINSVSFYEGDTDSENIFNKGKELASILGLELGEELPYEDLTMSLDEISDGLDQMYNEVINPKNMLDTLKQELKYLENFNMNSFKEMLNFEITLSELRDMNYFEFKLGILSKDNRYKLKKNYEGILAIIQHTGTSSEGEVFMIIYPKNQQEEISRILRTHSFKEIAIPKEYKETPKEILVKIENKKELIKGEILAKERILEEHRSKHKERFMYLMSQLHQIAILEDVKKATAVSEKYFYFSGILSRTDMNEINKILQKYDDIFSVFYDDHDFDKSGNKIWKVLGRNEKYSEGDASTENINNKDYKNTFGLAIYGIDNEIVSIRKKHEERLRKKKLEGQNKVYELEKELLDQYQKEAEEVIREMRSKKKSEVDEKQALQGNREVDQIEQEYIKIKPNLLETLWEEIIESKE
ncbi:MAG: hypothetical protein ACQEP4_02850 [Bacillota bacterium]